MRVTFKAVIELIGVVTVLKLATPTVLPSVMAVPTEKLVMVVVWADTASVPARNAPSKRHLTAQNLVFIILTF